jgi:hypothetical protein
MAAPLDRVKALLATLPKGDQAELRRYLGDILLTDDETESIHVASLQETRAGRKVTYTFRQERVRCGKAGCWCANGGGHGPYTYKYWRENGRLRKQYVKRPSGAAREVRARDSSAASRNGQASPA